MNLRYKLALAFVDFVSVLMGLLIALALRLDFDLGLMERYLSSSHWCFYGAVSLIVIAAFYMFGLYEKVWRYAGIHELLAVVYAVTTATVPVEGFVWLGAGMVYPRTGPIIAAFLWLSLCGGLRFLLRLASQRLASQGADIKRVLVVGANDCGEIVVRDLLRENSGHWPVGFLDDQPGNQGIRIHGIPVLGSLDKAEQVIKQQDIGEVILASPEPSVVRSVVAQCSSLGVQLRVVPSISDVVEGNVTVSSIRQVQIEDLLDRDPVSCDNARVEAYIKGKRVMVTGAGGSIGSEICRQVVRLGASELVLLGRGENSIYEIGLELRGAGVSSYICDIRDRARMQEAFTRFKPEVVFHTAAHKHVPLMEDNPAEAVSNNVFGSLQLFELAQEHQVEKLILISTDKAVNPTSVMGATKRMAELLLASKHIPGFAAVRFGNVLGSRGSVIPTFKKQIARGGPVTITHPEMTRFFMTIPEAVSLVLQAGAMAGGGEIYVLDMGRPMRIVDLARNLIRLSGFEPDVDIPIDYVGLRPGEKLYEELVNTGEETENTESSKITRVTAAPPPQGWPGDKLEQLRQAASSADDKATLDLLHELVPHYVDPPQDN